MPEAGIACWKHSVWRRLFSSERVKHLPDKTYVVFTFDTEEDWEASNCMYYDSYRYISSGALSKLVEGAYARDMSATFYVTPNLARDMPEDLRLLEMKKQAIGVHLHPHTVQNIEYPYSDLGKSNDKVTSYSFAKTMEYMAIAKGEIESVLGHEVILYRSGRLACDGKTERAAKMVGFKGISNHRGVYYIKPLDIWNLGVGVEDLFAFGKFDGLSKYIEHFQKRAKAEPVIVFSAHPMLLYNHAAEEIRERELRTFFEFVDYLKNQGNVQIINQYRLLEMVEEEEHK